MTKKLTPTDYRTQLGLAIRYKNFRPFLIASSKGLVISRIKADSDFSDEELLLAIHGKIQELEDKMSTVQAEVQTSIDQKLAEITTLSNGLVTVLEPYLTVRLIPWTEADSIIQSEMKVTALK